jgi:hypothetical protein
MHDAIPSAKEWVMITRLRACRPEHFEEMSRKQTRNLSGPGDSSRRSQENGNRYRRDRNGYASSSSYREIARNKEWAS